MPTMLLFSNVPYDCSDDLLKEWIEDRGYPVLSMKLIRDVVSGTSPSFAHVQLMSSARLDEAEKALDGQAIGGRTLSVIRVLTARATAERTRAAGANPR